MPPHHKLKAFFDEYLKAAGSGDQTKSPLFRSALRRPGLLNGEAMAARESPCTTKLYDRTGDEITFDEVERITICP